MSTSKPACKHCGETDGRKLKEYDKGTRFAHTACSSIWACYLRRFSRQRAGISPNLRAEGGGAS